MVFIVLCLGKANYFRKRQTLLMADRHAKETKTHTKYKKQ